MDKVRRKLPQMGFGRFRMMLHDTGEIFETKDFAVLMQRFAENVAFELSTSEYPNHVVQRKVTIERIPE